MVEEFQLQANYHRTLLFCGFCRYLLSVLPDDLQIIEAYADKRNASSIRLMEKLGMQACREDDSAFVHMRGSAEQVYLRLKDK